MALLDRALLLHSSLPPSPELVDCLSTHILFLNLQGRYDESDAAILRAFEALDAVGDDGGRSRILAGRRDGPWPRGTSSWPAPTRARRSRCPPPPGTPSPSSSPRSPRPT